MSENMDLNVKARQWLRQNRRDLFERNDLIVLAAQPHPFKFTRHGRNFEYERWSWNIHVHGNTRTALKDFLLMQIDNSFRVVDLYLVPYDRAIQTKTIAVYAGGQRVRTTWISQYRLPKQGR